MMQIDTNGIKYRYPCPCCGTADMIQEEGMYESCSTCKWEDDGYQRKYPDDNGANWMSLNVARKNYADHGDIWSDEDRDAKKQHDIMMADDFKRTEKLAQSA